MAVSGKQIRTLMRCYPILRHRLERRMMRLLHPKRVVNFYETGSMAMATATATARSMSPIEDRVAIVTGSSRGIGKAIVIHLASLGFKVVVNFTSKKEHADLVAEDINSSYPNSASGPRAIVVGGDVSDPDHVKLLFDEAERAFGCPVSVLVNSAGVIDSKYPFIANTSLEDFDRMFSINTRGSFNCCKEAANRLKRGGGGRIIMITSSLVAALKPAVGAYAASKAAVETMVKILAKELKGSGITANCVAPGPIVTDMYLAGKTEEQIKKTVEECPLSRLGQTKDVAPVVGFLATDAAEWVNGQVIRANGGYV